MIKQVVPSLLLATSFAMAQVPAPAPQTASAPAQPAWIATSNQYTNLLVEITKKHSPESASAEGLTEYDEKISHPTLADEDASIAETKAVEVKLKAALKTEPNKYVRQDLQILIHSGREFL